MGYFLIMFHFTNKKTKVQKSQLLRTQVGVRAQSDITLCHQIHTGNKCYLSSLIGC